MSQVDLAVAVLLVGFILVPLILVGPSLWKK